MRVAAHKSVVYVNEKRDSNDEMRATKVPDIRHEARTRDLYIGFYDRPIAEPISVAIVAVLMVLVLLVLVITTTQ